MDGWVGKLNPLLVSISPFYYLVTPYILPLSLFNCRRWCACHKFDSICKKYMQHLYLQINLLKTRFKDLSNNTNYVL